MSQDQERRTEEPTDRRLRDGRDEGQIARSRDVSAAAVTAAVLLAIWFGGHWATDRIRMLGRYALQSWARQDPGASVINAMSSSVEIGWMVMVLCLPVALIALAAAVLTNLVQAGGLFAPLAIMPKPQRINPVEGLRQLFSMNSAVELVKALLKIVLIGLTLYLVIRSSIGTLVKLPYLDIQRTVAATGVVFASFFGVGLLIFLLIAAFDFWFQRIRFLKQMRMTPEEVKRERREDLGNPEVRARRRAIALEAANDSVLERTAKASVVVQAAAEKLAVALIIPSDRSQSAWVLSKGADHMAAAILAVARSSRTRVIDDARMARLLHDQIAVDADVPDKVNAELRRYVG